MAAGRGEHFQQQAALGPLPGQGLEQPYLQCVVIAIVVPLSHHHPRRLGQAFDQCLGRHGLAIVQITDSPAERGGAML